MSDIKLFRIHAGQAAELQGDASVLEKPLQTLIESNLEALLGVRFLASEYSTGKTHAGRIDSLGLDENHCPVILEYKRALGENVINQGLFYLDWLMDHQAEFKLLVMEKLGKPAADAIDWTAPRLVCIASDFTKYDGHAVQQMNRNIELIRYRKFGTELLLLELASASSANSQKSSWSKTTKISKSVKEVDPETEKAGTPATQYSEIVASLSAPLTELLASLEEYVLSLGDDVQVKELYLYVAFKRLKNFATVVPQKSRLLLYLHLDPASTMKNLPIAKDVSKKGHWGTGDVEVPLTSMADLDLAKPFIATAYLGRSGAGKAPE